MPEEELFSSTLELKGPLQSTKTPKDGEPPDLFDRKLFEWQQSRLERQLRGEYESKVFRLNELVGGNLSTPLQVSSVRIEGAKITRPSFLSRIVSPYLNIGSTSYSDSTLESVLHQTRQISYALARTELFRRIVPEIETPQDPTAAANAVDIVFHCQERGRLSLKSATDIGTGDASASATAKLRNAFGGAEDLEGSVAFGMKTQHTYRVSLSAPLTSDMMTRGELSSYSIDNDYTSWASCKEATKGIKAAISTLNWLGRHEISYQAVLRNIHSLTQDASLGIRQAAGGSFKSSIRYDLVHDTRDDSIMGHRGMYLKLAQELAGLGGDTAIAKTEGEAQISRKLFNGLHISLATRAGIIYALGGQQTMFNDRFRLGGPMNIRSFKFNSLGPRDQGDSVGGDAFWAGGISLIGNIPQKPQWPLKPHLYINAGKLGSLDKARSLPDALRLAVANPSVSIGLGLVYRFDPVRLEVNFGMPLVAHKTDGIQRGFQIGFGLECL